jgi:two-component system, chemotaxis family, protein-glutamate methylesterase/glutaminase
VAVVRKISEMKLKWIVPSEAPSFFFDETLTSHCALVSKNKNKEIRGFCFFEARSLNKDFFDKILLRSDRGDFDGCELEIYFPDFLIHRFEQLCLQVPDLKMTKHITSFLKLKVFKGVATLRHRLKVMSVDDSPVILKFLKHSFEEMKFVDVIHQTTSPKDAVDLILEHNPDLITLDIQMPEMSGVEVLKKLLGQRYFPVIMISSLNLEEGSLVFDALNAGAFDYIAKPKSEERKLFMEELLRKSLSAIEGKGAHESLKKLQSKTKESCKAPAGGFKSNVVWAIGSSTGGTQALTHVFTSMPNNIPPTLVVQHIPPVFSKSFADSLNNLCPFAVKEAENGDLLKPNHVYIAPGGCQMSLVQRGDAFVIEINDDDPVNRFKPSVDYLFSRLAKVTNLEFVAGILTGMGRDGAAGLLSLRKAGAQTFAQDEATSTVYGMPRAALECGATDLVVSIDKVAGTLIDLSFNTNKKAA